VDSPQATMRARAAIRKALQIQDDHKGFALVEILSPCPTNWRMDSVKSNAWIREKMYPVFPLGVYRDRVDTAQPFTREHRDVTKQELYKIMDVEEESQSDSISPEHALQPLVRYKLAGFGGQGVLLLGAIIAQAGMAQGYRVTWLPSYGPEMRGGTANSSVILSSTPIGSPVVNDLDVLIALNEPSLERFLPDLQPGGVAIYDSTVIPNPPAVRDGIRLVGIPALQLAEKAGDVRATNVVLLGAYNAIAHVFDTANLNKALQEAFPKAKVLELNQRAVAAGAEFVNSSLVIPNS